MYSALRQGYIYILSRIDRLAALKGAAEPRKRRLKAQWFYMSKIIYLFIYLFIEWARLGEAYATKRLDVR